MLPEREISKDEYIDMICDSPYLWRFMDLITAGCNFEFAKLPANDKTFILLEGLKIHGFVSNTTKIEHFRVLFGIPLHKRDTPFGPIIWKKNKQLLRYFLYAMFPEKVIKDNKICIVSLFADIHGDKIVLPKSDLTRLKQSCDYSTLEDLLNKFNE